MLLLLLLLLLQLLLLVCCVRLTMHAALLLLSRLQPRRLGLVGGLEGEGPALRAAMRPGVSTCWCLPACSPSPRACLSHGPRMGRRACCCMLALMRMLPAHASLPP